MSSLTEKLDRQYDKSEKLAARARLHQNYTIAEVPWFTWVGQRLGLAEGAKVLDIGCGPGWFWAAAVDVLPDNLKLTLVDNSAGMVEEAINRCRPLKQWQVEGRQGDAAALPFADSSFDAVVSMHMLYHVPDPSKALAEFHRVLAPGGLLAVSTNGERNLAELYALTTAFGGQATEPVASIFGFSHAERLMGAQFGNVDWDIHPAVMQVTDADDVFLAMTSYPPGEGAPDVELAVFREQLELAFARGNGVLNVTKETALFRSRKAG